MYEFLDRRYAQALYDVAASKGKVDLYIEDLKSIIKVIEGSHDFQSVIRHPDFSTKEKKKVFINLFKGKIDEDLLTYLLILIEKDRILYLKEKLDELIDIDNAERGTIIARVFTVTPLKDYQRAALKEKLSARYHKKIDVREILDPELLGGIMIRVGDDLIDGSLRSTLDDLKQSMYDKIEVAEE